MSDESKKLAAFRAVDDYFSGGEHLSPAVVGIGSGSTIVFAVERLKLLNDSGKCSISACIPSSFQAEELILASGLPISSLNSHYNLDVAFDGADEVDSSLNCIKGTSYSLASFAYL